jgi:hypothetical protein
MVTGAGSNETVAPNIATKRRRRREQMEQDDSSDLSDDSDDDDLDPRPATQIKFEKLHLRSRAGSSPLRNPTQFDGPELMVTSPSRPHESSHLKPGPLRTGRPRTNTATTTTSSEISSENEFDSVYFQRKPMSSRRARVSRLLADRIQEDDNEDDESLDEIEEEDESDSSLSSAFIGSVGSGLSLAPPNMMDDSPMGKLPTMPRPSTPRASPKKLRPPPPMQKLRSLRPVSVLKPVSLLTVSLKGGATSNSDPFATFANLSASKAGTGKDSKPLNIRIYVPSSKVGSEDPFEMIILRNTETKAVTVAEAIGFALYQYKEEELEPPITGAKANVNKWNFRMVDDGEVEYDFPALSRTALIADFTSNNNRGPRGRSREKPWDEFALVEATDKEFQENETLTPQYSTPSSTQDLQTTTTTTTTAQSQPSRPIPTMQIASPSPVTTPYQNPITGKAFPFSSTAPRKDSAHLDTPMPTTQRAARTGLSKTLKIRFTDQNVVARTTLVEVTTDTYMAEVFDQACHRFRVDRALYVLKVTGSNTFVPGDRTVEALQGHDDLDLQRRRFMGDSILSQSPGSSSPNAPLLIAPGGTPKKGKPSKLATTMSNTPTFNAAAGAYKRYNVIRKQPMSFSSSSARIIFLDTEFLHIMPSEGPKAMWEMTQGKATTIPFTSVVGCKVSRKHPRMFRVMVFKERESKRYDFEALSVDEAGEIVDEIRKGMEASQPERLLEFGV